MCARGPATLGAIVRVTFFASREAAATQWESILGKLASTARMRASQRASGLVEVADTGSVRLTDALPGRHSSLHISHSAAAFSSTLLPGERPAGGVSRTGRRTSPS